jgi:membrane-associated protein
MWQRLSSRLENKRILQGILLGLIALGLYSCLLFVYRFFGLPSSEEIISLTRGYYETYGYWVVFIGAFVEGLLLINWYFPGSVVVALGVILARSSELNIFVMLFLVIAGFFITALFNYALGRYGWYHVFLKLGLKGPLDKVQAKVEDKGLPVLFSTYIHPNFGSLAATASGILRLSFKKFFLYSLISITLWNTFWTTLFYYIGDALLGHMSLLIIGGGVFVYIIISKSFKKESTPTVFIP